MLERYQRGGRVV